MSSKLNNPLSIDKDRILYLIYYISYLLSFLKPQSRPEQSCLATPGNTFSLGCSALGIKCMTSIPFSELLHLWHLCSDDEDFKTKANEMSTFFSNCNYSPNTIQSAINRISKISQAEALQPRPKQSTTKRTPLVLTYHPHMQ